MPKLTTISAVIAIWLVTAIAIASICKLAGIQVPIIAKIPNGEWLEIAIKLLAFFIDR